MSVLPKVLYNRKQRFLRGIRSSVEREDKIFARRCAFSICIPTAFPQGCDWIFSAVPSYSGFEKETSYLGLEYRQQRAKFLDVVFGPGSLVSDGNVGLKGKEWAAGLDNSRHG